MPSRARPGAGDFAQPLRCSSCRHEALDETIAAKEDLMTKIAPGALLAHALRQPMLWPQASAPPAFPLVGQPPAQKMDQRGRASAAWCLMRAQPDGMVLSRPRGHETCYHPIKPPSGLWGSRRSGYPLRRLRSQDPGGSWRPRALRQEGGTSSVSTWHGFRDRAFCTDFSCPASPCLLVAKSRFTRPAIPRRSALAVAGPSASPPSPNRRRRHPLPQIPLRGLCPEQRIQWADHAAASPLEHVGIDLRRAQVPMAELLLHSPDNHASLQQMGGKGAPLMPHAA